MKPEDFIPGNTYFCFTWYDRAGKYPDVITLIFRETTTSDSGKRVWIFDRPEVEIPDGEDEAWPDHKPELPYSAGEEMLDMFLDFDQLIEQLKETKKLYGS